MLEHALQVDDAGTALAFHTFQPPQSLLSLRPQQQQPPGDYYFVVRFCFNVWSSCYDHIDRPTDHLPTHTPRQATDAASGIYNFSPIFALSDQQRRRKLYGPIMWA